MQELEKVLEEIENERESYEAVHVRSYEKGLRYARDIIRKHLSRENAPETTRPSRGGWIPVEERLPEEGQEVWVSTKTECVRRGTYTQSFGDRRLEGFICTDGFMWMNTANAWMPYVIPEPYQPEVTKP